MIIFNTTFHAERPVCDQLINWLKEEYIICAIKDSRLSLPRLTRIIGNDETEGYSYSLQFQVKDIETLNQWYKECGDFLNESLKKRFKNSVVGFSTLLEVIDIDNIV